MRFFALFITIIVTSLFCKGQNPYEVQPKNIETPIKAVIEEEKFAKENFPFIHMADWKKGMRFMVENDKYADLYPNSLNLNIYKKSGDISPKLLQKDFQGKIFTVSSLEERQVSCPRGRCTRTYIIMECEGKKFEYEFIGSIDEMRKQNVFTSIDNLIYIDEIDRARELLINKNLYLLEEPLALHQNKFIPVKIVNIGIGSTLFGPVKIIYSIDSGKEYSTQIQLSGININSKIPKKFSELFCFKNPKDKYPDISEENWKLIQSMKVKIGMTENECKLSWGAPKTINTTIAGSVRQQQWVYSGSSYLYFESGKLTSIQN